MEHVEWMLRDIPERYHERLRQSSERLGRASIELCQAYEEYNAAIIERIVLNQEIRHGTRE